MHNHAHRYVLSAIIFPLATSLILSAPVTAQINNASDIERRAQQGATRHEQRLRQQSQEQERQRLQNAPDARLPESHSQAAHDGKTLPVETPCFLISTLQLVIPQSVLASHPTMLPVTSWRNPLSFAQHELNRYAGQCIGQEGINLIINRLTSLALAKGYSTTRFGISHQDLSQGTLSITAIPGIIREIRFKDASMQHSWQSAFPMRSGDLLNVRDIEQGLEQIKRVASQDADIQIVPGSQPGESDIIINLTHAQPWSVAFNVDNSGVKGTGKYQVGANVGYDNLLGINDILSAGLTSNADISKHQHATKNANIAYWIPYGYWSFGMSANYATYKQTIAGDTGKIESNGDTTSAELAIHHLFHRNQSQKNSLQFKIGKRLGHTYVNNTQLGNQQRNIDYIELGVAHVHYMGSTQLDLIFAQRWGHGIGALASIDSGTRGSFTMQTIDATMTMPFHVASHPLSYVTTVHGQSSPDALYAAEHLSIGNRYTVRGFDEELTLNSEKGFYWRNELNTRIGNTGQLLYAGIDLGKLYGRNVTNLAGNTLSGAVIGVRGAMFGVSGDISVGMPLSKPREFGSTSPTVAFNLAYGF